MSDRSRLEEGPVSGQDPAPRSGPPRPEVSRRHLLLGGGAALSAITLGGCGSEFLSLRPTDGVDAAGQAGPKGPEAPSLARLVEAGQLPPVKQRLPDNPLVLEPTDRIGQYGGAWRCALLNRTDDSWLIRTLGGEYLLRYDPMWETPDQPLPNVAENVEVSADGKVFTIHLRAGMKWSDGEPFTAEDVVFGLRDISFNKVISPIASWYLTSRGELPELRVVDPVTARITFPRPSGLFLERLAREGRFTESPMHYLRRFHADYNPDVEELAKDEGYSSWGDMFNDRNNKWQSVDKPTIAPWMVTTALGDASRMVARRNPYFWKVDPEGSQLPYLDEVTYDIIAEEQVILLKTTNGEIDFSTRHVNSLQNKPVLGHSRDRGDYRFVDLKGTFSNDLVLAFNLTNEDPGKREVFRNKDFRIGLSHAIDRQEMITAIWQRQGEPWQVAPAPGSTYHDEEFGTQYLRYDTDLANEHLDRAGLNKRNSDGWRLRPDGEPLVFEVEVPSPAMMPFWPDGTEAVCRFWRAVGVNARMKVEDRSLFYERKDNNKQDAGIWMGDGGLGGEVQDPRWYFPYNSESIFAPLWRLYFESRGENETSEKPPPETLRQMQLYWELIETPEAKKRIELMRQIIQIAKEQFYVIGTIRVPTTYGIVRNNFHNVPDMMPESAVFNTPYPAQPAQFYKT